jgi:hypothetical protein
MSEVFHSTRFGKRVWLTNHAIESMAKRRVTLDQVKTLVELGTYLDKGEGNGWIFHRLEERGDNLVCAAVVNGQALIVKTIMIHWSERGAR